MITGAPDPSEIRFCPRCGTEATDAARCSSCGLDFATDLDEPKPGAIANESNTPFTSRPTTIVRSYSGKQQHDAVRLFEVDAARLAQTEYFPTSQSWAPGQWGCGAFVIAALLAIVLIGLLIFVYLLVVKPEGTLTVTYTLSAANRAHGPVLPLPAVQPALRERLGQLESAHEAGLVTDEEYRVKRSEILSQL